MSDIVHTIHAGSSPIYEIVVSGDRLRVFLRHADDHSQQIGLISSAIPSIIAVLNKVVREVAPSGETP